MSQPALPGPLESFLNPISNFEACFSPLFFCAYHSVNHKSPLSPDRPVCFCLCSASLLTYLPFLLSLSLLCDATWLSDLEVPFTYHGVLSVMGPMLVLLPVICLNLDERNSNSSEIVPRKAATGVGSLHSLTTVDMSSMRTPETSRIAMGLSDGGQEAVSMRKKGLNSSIY